MTSHLRLALVSTAERKLAFRYAPASDLRQPIICGILEQIALAAVRIIEAGRIACTMSGSVRLKYPASLYTVVLNFRLFNLHFEFECAEIFRSKMSSTNPWARSAVAPSNSTNEGVN